MLLDLLFHHHPQVMNPGVAPPRRSHVPVPLKPKRRPRARRQQDLIFLKP